MSRLTCAHCLAQFPERDAVRAELKGLPLAFCCNGCRGIYFLIHQEGLADFYRNRKWDETGVTTEFMKEPDIRPFEPFVTDKGAVREISLYIGGIRCASCVWLNEKILTKMPGIIHARINYATHQARIRWNPQEVSLVEILKRIVSIGYRPQPYSESVKQKAQKAEARDLLIRFGTAAFLSSQLMIYSIALYAGYFQGIDRDTRFIFEVIALCLTLPVLLYSGMPFLKNTVRGLRRLHFTMDALITFGSGSAFLYSICQMVTGGEVYFDTAAMIITLILLGRFIEASAKGNASEAIEKLSGLRPDEARVLAVAGDGIDGERIMTPLSSVDKGALVEVIPGEKIPLDGLVVHGESEVDESLLTGESRPVHKGVGATVIGGSINLFGTLVFKVTKTGEETTLSGIIRAVEDAQATKPPLQRLADRIVGWFVPAVLLLAIATVAAHLIRGASSDAAVMAGIAVLVIACPCSLGLATPLAVLMFSLSASAKGIVTRSAEVIERCAGLTHVIFDKTGTITRGEPVLREVIVTDPSADKTLLVQIAASLERLSEHTLGRAIVAASETGFLSVSDFAALPGRGLRGIVNGEVVLIGNRSLMDEHAVAPPDTGHERYAEGLTGEGVTIIYMAARKRVQALFAVSDQVRDEARNAVGTLRDMGIPVRMISGDNRRTTESIAAALGIDDAVSGASPLQKKEALDRLQSEGKRVMMVGDGINDAPALTAAHVGVAMGRRTDIAMESADAVLMRDDLALVPFLIRLSRKTYSLIRQNIFWAFFYNIVALPLAVAGLLHPIIAAGAMAASSLFVVFNSLRIRRIT